MSLLTRVRPTTSSAKIALSEGEKQISEENDAVTECPNSKSQSAIILAFLKMWLMNKWIP